MPLSNCITIRVDASTRQGDGAGVAFISKVTDPQGNTTEHRGRRFIHDELSTTDAETHAALYGVTEMWNFFRNRTDKMENYEVIIESDCEHTVRKINETWGDDTVDQFFSYFRRNTEEFRARWIARSNNEVADSMAREAFRSEMEKET